MWKRCINCKHYEPRYGTEIVDGKAKLVKLDYGECRWWISKYYHMKEVSQTYCCENYKENDNADM